MRRKTFTIVLFAGCFLAAALAGAASNAPATRVLDGLQNVYGPVTFDHQKHSAIAGNCGACHHEHSIGDGLPCKQCHALAPETFKKSVSHGFMACRSCHGAFDPDNAGMPGLKTAYHKKCFGCHRGMGDIGKDPKGCSQLCHEKLPQKSAGRAPLARP